MERDEEFWQMIHERRKEESVPLAEVKKRYGLNGKKADQQKAKRKK